MILALKYPLMQLSPMFTGAAGSPLTATIRSSFTATMIPQPAPQNRQTDLSHFHPISAFSAIARRSCVTVIPAAVAAAAAAVVLMNSAIDNNMPAPVPGQVPFLLAMAEPDQG